ncbi:MAG: chromosomal replication initiator protein DnaA, partial [Chloroflexota bacterium]|nr:chromosomal replication initiator protein DnaA [Chloroflexota bacterium]
TETGSRSAVSVAPPALNAALTFDAFVVGDENRHAHDAALRAATEPGSMTPLTIFGTSGLGKTHLLHAIGHAAYERGLSVIYATAERFGNDYVRALGGGLEAFRRRYRSADILLIDDVQFFEGKEKFQEEFFHTFNDLHNAGKQIVVTTDRVPTQLGGIIESLRSRLQWGLAVDVQRPAFETRLAILRAKSQRHAHKLPDSALEVIAERCCPTVRELEGYLNRVLAYVPMLGRGGSGGHVTKEIIDHALSPFAEKTSADAPPPSPEAIIDAVCRRTGLQPADIRGRSRSRDVTYARHLAMYLLKEDGRKSAADIGRLCGHRDHSTVLAGITRIGVEQTTRPETKDDIAAARESLATATAEQRTAPRKPDARANAG